MKDLDVLILCGGIGSRLRSIVSDRPKSMALINGRPFLDIIIKKLQQYNIKRIILCTGYGGEQIASHYNEKKDPLIIISKEVQPLGTAGAIRNAFKYIKSENFFLLNGDSICNINYKELYDFHIEKNALITTAVSSLSDRLDVGVITLSENSCITNFNEKSEKKLSEKQKQNRFVNTGIYVMKKNMIAELPLGIQISLEMEVLPNKVLEGNCYGYFTDSKLIDIGTPDRFYQAQLHLDDKSHSHDPS